MEPAIIDPFIEDAEPGHLAGRPLDEWNAAYVKVERYFCALRLRNKVVLGQLVLGVLRRAAQRAPHEPELSATELAVEEMDRIITAWFADILGESPSGGHMLSTRGRLALLLAEMPDRWQDQFLRPGPWPEEFVTAMREAYLGAGPDFQRARMTPRPLDLGPVSTLVNLTRRQYFKASVFVAWAVFAIGAVWVFIRLHVP